MDQTILKLCVLFLAVNVVGGKAVTKRKTTPKLTPLKVESCAGDTNVFHLRKLALHPYPVRLPSNLTVNVEAEMDHLIVGPFDIDVDISRSMFFWVPIPCVSGVGSCTYESICQHPNGTDAQMEIEKVFGFPLQGCIIPKFKIALTVNEIALPDVKGIAGFMVDYIASGTYKIEATIRNKEKKIACVRLVVELD